MDLNAHFEFALLISSSTAGQGKGKGGMKPVPHIQLKSRLNSFGRLFLKAFSLSAIVLIAISIFFTLFLIPPTNAHAQITLVWDPPVSGPAPAGYLIYYGIEQHTYSYWIDVGNPAGEVKKYTFTGLILDRPHFFAVKAYALIDNFRGFSGFSNEAIYDPRPISASIGIFRKPEGIWYFDSNHDGLWSDCERDSCLGPFGGYWQDIPLEGDWTGNGDRRIGIYRDGNWFFDYNGSGNWDDCAIDKCIGGFRGNPEDIPIVGDWNGKGITKMGVFNQGTWILDNGNGIYEGCGIDSCLGPFGGYPGDIPVIGDWRGDGVSKIGIYRAGQWYLDMNGNGGWDGCEIDKCIDTFWGYAEDIPVVGDWNGDGISKIGIYRYGNWYLDFNGNGVWEGCIIDRCVAVFGGYPGDIPIIR